MSRAWLLLFCCLQFHLADAQQKIAVDIRSDQPGAEISPAMWGVFFEDINMGADGGLYAELVKNRSFEFPNPLMGWSLHGRAMQWGINFGGDIRIINQGDETSANPRFMRVDLSGSRGDSLGITNEGFRGMGIKKGMHYDFSVRYRQQLKGAILTVELAGEKGETIASGTLEPPAGSNEWHRAELQLTATVTDPKARLNIWFSGSGIIDLDMISLFPADTWKGRKGGLRGDMVQALADLKPGFVRFPGGCIVEGRDLSTRYRWKQTLGPLEDRKLIVNRWNTEVAARPAPDYYQSFGLGFYEYFQLAEDLGAEPLPILNCGMACQFNTGELADLEDLGPYVQDALDLVEFANGSQDTKWGSVRANLGHPAPFGMRMLGIGNENWGPQYIERLKIFQKAIRAKYPEIQLVCSSGFMPEGEVFNYLNSALREMQVDYIDEHYYNSPEWFLKNAGRYDQYDRRSASKVIVGEYAVQSDRTTSPKNRNNWRTALSEAAFMTGLERNADIIRMASYAPLFGHADGWQWRPDLIWVDNLSLLPTPNYHVQKLYANHRGTHVIPVKVDGKAEGRDSLFVSAVMDQASHELIVKMVNVSGLAKTVDLRVRGKGIRSKTAKLITLHHPELESENSFGKAPDIAPVEETLQLKGNTITVAMKAYSFVLMRIER